MATHEPEHLAHPIGPGPLALAMAMAIASPVHAAPAGDDDGKPRRPTDAETGPPRLRCGWWDNPTPGNVFFTDRDGDWTIAMQGDYEADGRWPDFSADQIAPRHASHYHACACAKMQVDPESGLVSRFTDARARPLRACRTDPALARKEPVPR